MRAVVAAEVEQHVRWRHVRKLQRSVNHSLRATSDMSTTQLVEAKPCGGDDAPAACR
jgi:hypothetical protein